MVKTVGIITVFGVLLVTFFLGVNYSDSVKKQYSWIFEKEETLSESPTFERDNAIDTEAVVLEEDVKETSEEIADNVTLDAPKETITTNEINTTE